MNWRNRLETDIDEVLQIAQVFSNVSKVGADGGAGRVVQTRSGGRQ